MHLEQELYPDGGYLERCGYHAVVVNFVMQAMMTIRANGADDRFPEAIGQEEDEVMAEADLFDTPSHGVRVLPGLLKGLRYGIPLHAEIVNQLREAGVSLVL
jgi:LDH2 family malate/lactate/ureidoglycolate dehydrogenase